MEKDDFVVVDGKKVGCRRKILLWGTISGRNDYVRSW
jgi:hypothetical protein